MVGPAASVAAAAGLGWLVAVWGGCCWVGVLAAELGWPLVGLNGCLLQIGLAWLQIGPSSGKAGGLLLPTLSAGLIHQNQPTVCKGNAFSWNKYQK